MRNKGIRSCLYFLIVFLIFLPSCSSKPKSTASLVGVVYDADSNEPVAGVTVRYGTDNIATTSIRGVFELNNLPQGEVAISFEKDGYKPQARNIQIMGEKEFVEVLLVRSETIALTTDEGVKLRSTPSISGDILEALPKSTKVVLTGSTNAGWYEVKLEDKTGWVWGGYLSSNDVSIPRAVVAKDSQIVDTPESSNVLQEIGEGFTVIILSTENNWNKVLLPDGTEGWISSDTLSP